MLTIEYRKTDGGLPKLVVCHFPESNQPWFEDRSVRDAQFTRFVPSDEERKVSDGIRGQAEREGGARRLHFEGPHLVIDWGGRTAADRIASAH
jgi:hypothetical protein